MSKGRYNVKMYGGRYEILDTHTNERVCDSTGSTLHLLMFSDAIAKMYELNGWKKKVI